VFSGVSELVQSALDGYHVCLFSYGQTGAGKTYTMQGGDTQHGRGIIPRAVEKVEKAACASTACAASKLGMFTTAGVLLATCNASRNVRCAVA
jgi:hypothetical protein